MTSDEETGIVQADIAEFEETSLVADTVDSPLQDTSKHMGENTNDELNKNLQHITDAVIYQQVGSIGDNVINKKEIVQGLALLENFIPRNFDLKLKRGNDSRERIEYIHPKDISLQDAKILLKNRFSDTHEFLLETDFGKAYDLNFSDNQIRLDFNKIKSIPEIGIIFSYMNGTSIGTTNPYLYLFTRPFEERAFLAGVINKKGKLKSDMNLKNDTLDSVRNFYNSISLTDVVSYAKEIRKKNIAEYIVAIRTLTNLNL